MWIKHGDREILLDLLAGTKPSEISQARRADESLLHQPPSNEIVLAWLDNPRNESNTNPVIITGSRYQKDLLAWASTFLPAISPFTAYFRVLTEKDAHLLRSPTVEMSLWGLDDACIGLILCEATLASDSPINLTQSSLHHFYSTYSYCTARSLALGLLEQGTDITNPWAAAKAVTKQPTRSSNFQVLQQVWSLLLRAGRPEPLLHRELFPNVDVLAGGSLVLEACSELKQAGSISKSTWEYLCRSAPEFVDARIQMKGSREDRILLAERAIRRFIHNGDPTDILGGFLCGYLISLVGPGTLDYLPLLAQESRSNPSAVLWYGVCAGLAEKSDLKNSFGGTGRRLLRELYAYDSIWSPPRCDLSLQELEVLQTGERPTADFKTTLSGYISIEISPCVNLISRWPASQDHAKSKTPPTEQAKLPLTEQSQAETESLLNELGQVLNRADSVYRKLSREISGRSYKDKSGRYDPKNRGR